MFEHWRPHEHAYAVVLQEKRRCREELTWNKRVYEREIEEGRFDEQDLMAANHYTELYERNMEVDCFEGEDDFDHPTDNEQFEDDGEKMTID